MKQYSIDRFEGSYALLIDEEGTTVKIFRTLLPLGAKEGSVLTFDNNQYYLESKATEQKRNEVKGLIEDLFE